MNFKIWLENPINNLELIGAWDKGIQKPWHGYRPNDIGILSSPAGQAKIIKKWSNSKENFEIYFIRSPQGMKTAREQSGRAKGEVSEEFIKQNLGVDVKAKSDTIILIFTHNSGAERFPLTSYVIAHRVGHMISRTKTFEDFYKYLKKEFQYAAREIYGLGVSYRNSGVYNYYNDLNNSYAQQDNMLVSMAYALGTMKSARDRNIRNFDEFCYELLAQYINTGKIKFNKLTKYIKAIDYQNTQKGYRKTDRFASTKLDQEELEGWQEYIDGIAATCEDYLGATLSSMVGKIFLF